MTDSELLVLGVDGGGTSTIAWLADAGGTVIGRGKAGGSNMKAIGPEAALDALRHAIGAAFDDASRPPGPVEVACLGLAGFDRPEDRQLLGLWAEGDAWARRLLLVNDGDLVLAAGTPEGWGVGLIAGTGSICVGRTPDGRTARRGGLGSLLGDEGSAYAVAISALRAVARRADGRGGPPHDGRGVLAARLCEALVIPGPAGLVSAVYAPGMDRARIAALAPAVVAAAEVDPEVEAALLGPAGRDLAELVLSIVPALDLSVRGPVPLALGGSFLLSAPAVSRSLFEALGAAGLTFSPITVREPVRGAVVLAGRSLEGA